MKKLINIIFSIIFVVMLLFSFKSFSNEDGGLNFLDNIFSKEKTDDMEILYRNVEKHKDDNEKTMWIYENFENLEDKDKYLVGNDIDASEFIYNLRTNNVNFNYYPGVSIDYGRETPYFLQWDNRWAYNLLGDSNIGFAGCGPTSMAMVLKRLNPNLDINPINIANDAQSYMSSSGIEWKFFSDEAKRYGYNIQSIENNKNSIIDALDRGSLIVSVKKGDFTLFGHILVIDSYKFGRFIINDPNSMKNSEKTWSYSSIKDQIVNIWLVY
ncbi:MAG: C39 family peptidase [Anaerococcus hydrogenalis]|uniref:C39 family peptidase n=1 Tax=Anaerococcus hydrogenalis TaxID=33029 RepID=UPI002900EE95|nr:C39 family peptidase [Anaerococcus hydrogenalis]MDU1316813.1 C39 family peptidase [Anaerococcus hydrogenalis]MDU2582110.1 C39 family peptidase [Anaerococcus hydrogenalis]